MAKIILKDASISVNGVDLSDRADQVTIEDSAEEVETTAFGNAYKQYDQGLKDATITVAFQQDFALASVDATLQPLYDAATAFPVVIKPTPAAVSATNPSYTMESKLYTYSPLGGAVGELVKSDTTFRCADDLGVVKAVA